jgi:hypothetical protein
MKRGWLGLAVAASITSWGLRSCSLPQTNAKFLQRSHLMLIP